MFSSRIFAHHLARVAGVVSAAALDLCGNLVDEGDGFPPRVAAVAMTANGCPTNCRQ
jgi:hypothetical protein